VADVSSGKSLTPPREIIIKKPNKDWYRRSTNNKVSTQQFERL
jgi:hypothetical protein